jgi:hypothetical protein
MNYDERLMDAAGDCSKLIRVAYFACIAISGEISRLGLGVHRRRVPSMLWR